MPTLDTKFTFAVLGALFAVLGAVSCWRAGRLASPGRTWLLIGLIFSAVAAWLNWTSP